MFPLWEKEGPVWTLNYKNDKPIPVTEFIEGIGKFSRMSEEQIADVQRAANERYATVRLSLHAGLTKEVNMYIDPAKCVKCKKCVPYCPVGAIKEADGHMTIDLDACVECCSCLRYAKCPRDAIYNVRLEPPRAYRKAFSDPFGKHENTTLKHAGRGTEEVKTNDVTGIIHDLDTIASPLSWAAPRLRQL